MSATRRTAFFTSHVAQNPTFVRRYRYRRQGEKVGSISTRELVKYLPASLSAASPALTCCARWGEVGLNAISARQNATVHRETKTVAIYKLSRTRLATDLQSRSDRAIRRTRLKNISCVQASDDVTF